MTKSRMSPPQGEWRFGEPPPGARAAPPEAHESLVSRENVAELPLTNLSLEIFGTFETRVKVA